MARLVFNKDNLMQIKEGLNLLFDLFIDVIDTPFEHGNCFTHSEVMLRFESVRRREDIPAKVLLDMINVFNQIRQDCVQKLEGYQKMFAEVSKEKRQLEAHLAKLELKESEQRVASTQEKTEYKSARSTIEFLEKALKEKNEKIAEDMFVEDNGDHDDDDFRDDSEIPKGIQTESVSIAKTEERTAVGKREGKSLSRLPKEMVDDQYKRLRLKSELTGGPLMPAVNKSEDELKRQIYLLEKGIRSPIIVGETLTDPDTGQIPFKDFVRLNSMVDSLATAMAEGDIESARSSLPPHYTYLPSDFKVKRVKRVSNVSRFKLPPMRGISSRHLVGKRGNNENGGEFDEYEGPIEENPELVVRALTSMGLQFTAQQAEEAMKEADVNRSRSLDFYEYVLVADKLIEEGKGEREGGRNERRMETHKPIERGLNGSNTTVLDNLWARRF
ncbi:hypothetical protein C0Q70_21518 [Pomacea canaliculata]|uniref:EF-hand domain-containing protein n=1 Tax=Pomacea canaliculata TaxID=400727 RepID=A0A2T7NCR3_POMCA|nr:hypothetical protein C0Q70_21518 [Pomacea canaliculata]